MASLKFPDTGTRYVEYPNGKPAVNQTGYLYKDEDLTVVADAYADDDGTKGALLALDDDGRRFIRTDAYGRQIDYWGPDDDTDRLWIVVNGVKSIVDADYNPRFDNLLVLIAALAERVAELEAGSGTPTYGFTSGSTGLVIGDDTAPGIDYADGILTVDDILAAGVSYADGILTVTTA